MGILGKNRAKAQEAKAKKARQCGNILKTRFATTVGSGNEKDCHVSCFIRDDTGSRSRFMLESRSSEDGK